jgi:hypothetical protein
VDECQFTNTPAGEDPVCRQLDEALNTNPGELAITTESGNEAILVDNSNSTIICYQTQPGPFGWCHVEPFDPDLEYGKRNTWGFCGSACHQQLGQSLGKGFMDQVSNTFIS